MYYIHYRLYRELSAIIQTISCIWRVLSDDKSYPLLPHSKISNYHQNLPKTTASALGELDPEPVAVVVVAVPRVHGVLRVSECISVSIVS